MFSNIISVAFLVTLASLASAADFVFDTPTLVQCQPTKFTWTGGNAAYAIFVVPYNDPCGDAVAEVGVTPNNFKTWNVTAPAGAKVQVLVEDSDANEAWTGIITVGASDDSSCVDPNAVAVLKAAGALATTSAAASSSAAVSSAAAGVVTGAAAAASTPAIASSVLYPSASAGSSAADTGIANAANSSSSVTSASMPRAAVPAASALGMATLLFTAFLL